MPIRTDLSRKSIGFQPLSPSTVKSIFSLKTRRFASYGIADQYRLVDGTITLQRPAKIFLAIQFTFVDIAQMASDGEHFELRC